MTDVTCKIGRETELAMEARQPTTWLPKIEPLERDPAETDTHAAEVLRRTQEQDVHAMLGQLAQGINVNSETGALKNFLREMVECVELEDSTCRNHYLLAAGGVCLASPRGFEPRYSP